MKNLIPSAFLALCLMAPAAVHAQPAGQTSSESKSLLQILFPPSENYTKFRRSDKSPIKRKVISFKENHPEGTIIIDTSDRRLYHVTGKGKAMVYGIGVGRDGFTCRARTGSPARPSGRAGLRRRSCVTESSARKAGYCQPT